MDDLDAVFTTCIGILFSAVAITSFVFLLWVTLRKRSEIGDHLKIMKQLRHIHNAARSWRD